MSGAYSQDKRVAKLDTPLGDNKLILTRFEGTEAMSRPFEFRLEAFHADRKVDFNSAIGKNCTVTVGKIDGKEKRYFVGSLVETRLLRSTETGFLHELVLRPWITLIDYRVNSRIFYDKSVIEVVEKVLGEHSGLGKFKTRTSKSYPKLEYCVQHKESDMRFVSRLLEAHGISYRFEFAPDQQTMILGDGSSAYDPIAGSTRNFYDIEQHHQRQGEHLFAWSPTRRFTTGKVALNDYDLKKPNANLKAEKHSSPGFDPSDLEDYTHPYHSHLGEQMSQAEGDKYAQSRIDMHRAMDNLHEGRGDLLSAAPGLLLSLAKTPKGAFDGQYLVLRADHLIEEQDYRSGGSADGPFYQGTYEFMPAAQDYAPPLLTPKPFIAGPQTGRVVSRTPGLEIDCDDLGRIFVHFHWDRESDTKPEGRTLPCRVAQLWAGANWGGIFIPRVDMEVLIQFVDGDPDRPVVVGTVYNGNNKPPYPLPSKKNIAGWKSRSTEDGGQGYNEFIMDDSKGSELVRLHAERDLNSKIENNEERKVGVDRSTNIGNNDDLKAVNEITIVAGTKITLRVGASSITIDNTSITLQSINIVTQAGATSTHTAGGVVTITGAAVIIN